MPNHSTHLGTNSERGLSRVDRKGRRFKREVTRDSSQKYQDIQARNIKLEDSRIHPVDSNEEGKKGEDLTQF